MDMVLDGFVDKEKWVNFRVDQEVVVETVPEEDEVHDDAWESTDDESEAEDGEDDDDEDGSELDLEPESALSPYSQARAGGGDTEEDSGPGTYPYPSSDEADPGVENSGNVVGEDAMDGAT